MKLSAMDFKMTKGRVILITAGVLFLFLVLTFAVSYYEYSQNGPKSDEPASLYHDDSFNRLYDEFTKDKPSTQGQKELLADIVEQDNKRTPSTKASYNNGNVYTKGTLDTLAVNCAILLEQYKELVIKNHELEKQLKDQKASAKAPASRPRSGSASRVAQSGTNAGFDYTRYIRSSSSNELLNQAGNGSARNTPMTWISLTLRQEQRVFDQSVVAFEVVEGFDLDGQFIPEASSIEGVAQVSRGRGRVLVNFNRIDTYGQTILVEGEAYSLDRSRGIQVYLQGESAVAEGLKREATDIVGLLDPSRTGVARSLVQDPDLGREVYATLDAGTMILASIRKR